MLLHLYLIFVAVPVLTLAVTGFVELDIRSLSVELYVLTTWDLLEVTSTRSSTGSYISLFFANHDWRFQMYVKNHEKLVFTRLEEQVLDITEQYVLGRVSVGWLLDISTESVSVPIF